MPDNQQPDLPNELLLRILHIIGSGDKPTLAACMRVSPMFNELAAPLLYGNIVIDDSWGGEAHRLLDITPPHDQGGTKIEGSRRVQGKEKALDYLRFITIKELNDGTLDRWDTSVEAISSVRHIRLNTLSSRSGRSYLGTLMQVFPNASTLTVAEDLYKPFNNTSNWPNAEEPVKAWARNMIYVINDDFISFPPGVFAPLYTSLAKIVWVIDCKCPSASLVIEKLGNELARIKYTGTFYGEIVVVGLEYIHTNVADLQSTIARYVRFFENRSSHTPAPTESPPITSQTKRVLSIRAVTMKEYLDTTDWKGQFTVEEVTRWTESERTGFDAVRAE
jgi:hypothetical protein